MFFFFNDIFKVFVRDIENISKHPWVFAVLVPWLDIFDKKHGQLENQPSKVRWVFL